MRESSKCLNVKAYNPSSIGQPPERLCRAVGTGSLSTEYWVTVAELGDALTKKYELDKRMYQLATQQLGFTDEEWERIKRPPLSPSATSDTTTGT
jgi:hypothetical protein